MAHPPSSRPRLAPPHVIFSRSQWAELRDPATPVPSESDLLPLGGINDPAIHGEVVDVLLPLARLIELHRASAQALQGIVHGTFAGLRRPAVPYVIAIAGSVAVGKSTFARVLRSTLASGGLHPRVDLVATDGFLYSTRSLQERGLIGRKGFPESYDLRRMLAFLEALKAGTPGLQVPMYSHEAYDVVPGDFQVVNVPDILIFEGLNVLQTRNSTGAVASDFFDFTIYLDADTPLIEDWYIERFLKLQRTVFQRETSFFHHYKDLPLEAARDVARNIWQQVNLPNLLDNIAPTRRRAQVVLRKGRLHQVEEVWMRQN